VWSNNQALGLVFGYATDSPQGDLYSHIHDAITVMGLRAVKQQP
jgi:hypothetical protein